MPKYRSCRTGRRPVSRWGSPTSRRRSCFSCTRSICGSRDRGWRTGVEQRPAGRPLGAFPAAGWGQFAAGGCSVLVGGPADALPDGRDADGEPGGRPWPSSGSKFDAKAQIVAVSPNQTANACIPLLRQHRTQRDGEREIRHRTAGHVRERAARPDRSGGHIGHVACGVPAGVVGAGSDRAVDADEWRASAGGCHSPQPRQGQGCSVETPNAFVPGAPGAWQSGRSERERAGSTARPQRVMTCCSTTARHLRRRTCLTSNPSWRVWPPRMAARQTGQAAGRSAAPAERVRGSGRGAAGPAQLLPEPGHPRDRLMADTAGTGWPCGRGRGGGGW